MTPQRARIEIAVGPTTRPFDVRVGSDADRGVVQQVFERAEYDLRGMAQAPAVDGFYRAVLASGRSPLIVDAGANIGASVVWHSLTWPASHVAAIEPEAGNCALLRANAEGLDVELLEAGIGSADGLMYLEDPGRGEWAFRLSPTHGSAQVRVIAARSLVARQKERGCTPFILKVDIEGGEADLFRGDVDWVAEFPLLVVELHDWLFPGEARSRAFLRTVVELEMDFVHRGEHVFCFNNRLLAGFAASAETRRLEALRRVAAASPSAEAYLELSLACCQARDFPAALEACARAIALEPDLVEAHNNMGVALNELGRYAEAIQALETALRIAPEHRLARNNLAWARARQMQTDLR